MRPQRGTLLAAAVLLVATVLLVSQAETVHGQANTADMTGTWVFDPSACVSGCTCCISSISAAVDASKRAFGVNVVQFNDTTTQMCMFASFQCASSASAGLTVLQQIETCRNIPSSTSVSLPFIIPLVISGEDYTLRWTSASVADITAGTINSPNLACVINPTRATSTVPSNSATNSWPLPTLALTALASLSALLLVL